jgi:TRAP-type mannitol/chloroaromatic compound transport system permease small subunit
LPRRRRRSPPRVNDGLLALCRYLIIAIVAGLAAILISAVFYRYALNNAIAWWEEGSKYLMVWLTFIGAPIALRTQAALAILTHHGSSARGGRQAELSDFVQYLVRRERPRGPIASSMMAISSPCSERW